MRGGDVEEQRGARLAAVTIEPAVLVKELGLPPETVVRAMHVEDGWCGGEHAPLRLRLTLEHPDLPEALEGYLIPKRSPGFRHEYRTADDGATIVRRVFVGWH